MINYNIKDSIFEIMISTDINFETSRQIEMEINDMVIPDHVKNVEIDLSKVRFIDSSGVSLMIKWLHPLTSSKDIKLKGTSDPIKNVLKICKLDQFVTVL